MTSLLGGILHDAQDLFRQQIALFRREIRDDLCKTRDATIMIMAGIVVLAVGAVFFMTMLPLLLNWLVPSIPLWGCFGIVGLVGLVPGGLLIFLAVRRLQSIDPLHNPSVEALKENLKWTTPPT